RCAARQVALALAHLLGNAAAFALPGTPAQAVISLAHADGMAVLSVADRGRGIEPRDQAHLFRLFATGGRGPEYGAGVGLAICRAVAEGHGGRAWLESAPGRGTTVHLSFAGQ
ncbi:MAG: sensor histidine kinase, partial [Planctomycetes bacterium]|nr:sensor histidine kinase [Planctomycetota bacterium]